MDVSELASAPIIRFTCRMAVNPYTARFVEDLRARYPVDGSHISYSQWISLNTKLAGRPFSYAGFEFQQAIVDDMSPDLSVIKPSQTGLALALDTPIATPTGWSTMGELQVGDVVLDEQGKPTTITYVSPIFTDHDCFEVVFDNGEVITADGNHRWYVEALSPFKGEVFHRTTGRAPRDFSKSGVLNTRFIAKTFSRGNRHVYAIPNTKALQLPEQDLLVDPYYLGLWLGDGNTHASVLTGHKTDLAVIIPELERRGLVSHASSRKGDTLQVGFDLPRDRNICPRGHDKDVVGRTNQNACKKCQKQNNGYEEREPSTPYDTIPSRLNQLGLLGQAKFIPPQYLRGSIEQRKDLMRGLLDSDGSCSRGRLSFHNTNQQLVDGFIDLAHSLGFKTHSRLRAPDAKPTGFGRKLPIWEVSFAAYKEDAPFFLPRKLNSLRSSYDGRPSEALRHRITDVREIASVPTRCISVDSPNHLFLAGRGMIPTHNTEVQIRKFLAILARNRGTSGIFTFPDEKMFKKNSKTRIRPVVIQPAFSTTGIDTDRPQRSVSLFEVNGSFAHIMGMTEGDATSTPADFLFHDELDLSDPTMIGLYQSRLQNSTYRVTQAFSTPTHPGYGIDARYNSSDQRQYMVRCRCGHWQAPTFTMPFLHLPGYDGDGILDELDADMVSRIDLNAAFVKCERCSQALDLTDPSLREWVARHPSRLSRGYKVSPFSPTHGRLNIKYIVGQLLKMRDLDQIKGWHNTVLGEPHSDGNSKLEPFMVQACMTTPQVPDVPSWQPVALGCDMGRTCHLTLGIVNREGIHPFLFEQIPSSRIHERISQLREKYNIVTGCVDRHPYTPDAEHIRDASGRQILPMEYRGATTFNIKNDEYGNIDHIQANRTQVIDNQIRAIRERTTKLSGYGGLGSVVIEHLCDMVRIETDHKPASWEKLTGNDHFLHSLTLMRASIKVRELVTMQDASESRSFINLVAVPQPTKPVHARVL